MNITFPNNTKSNDKWIVYVPNTEIATYSEAKADYEKSVANLKKTITDAEVNLTNGKQELANMYMTDSSSYRNLTVEKATSALAEAKQKLYKFYDVVKDRDIVAPFSGTVEGMSNVVVGATPTGGSADATDLGTLIADEFLATFSLGAVDVAKIEVGQKVLVTVTSFANAEPLEARITEISSLPDDSGVAQYEVLALIEVSEDFDLSLREGLLADIQVVEKEATGVLRVPSSAIVYERGVAKVEILDSVTEAQQQMINRLGILRSETGSVPSYSVEVQVGLTGAYYVEITDGLEEGAMIIASTDAAAAEETSSVVRQQGTRGEGPPQ